MVTNVAWLSKCIAKSMIYQFVDKMYNMMENSVRLKIIFVYQLKLPLLFNQHVVKVFFQNNNVMRLHSFCHVFGLRIDAYLYNFVKIFQSLLRNNANCFQRNVVINKINVQIFKVVLPIQNKIVILG